MSDIFQKSLSDWTWDDLKSIIVNELEESQKLEFKNTLPTATGDLDPWQQGKQKVGDYAKKELAKEIVAFANAYGGYLIIGIAESQAKPKHAETIGDLIRDCERCITDLERSLRSIIDPPLNDFEARAIADPSENGKGMLIFRVGSSSMAPHGYGRPPVVYIRRGEQSEPPTMRDLQNIFWEARTKFERITKLQSDRSNFFQQLIAKKNSGKLYHHNTLIKSDAPCLAFRCTIIPEDHLHLKGIANDLMSKGKHIPRLVDVNNNEITVSSPFGQDHLQWKPKAHGAQANSDNGSVWTILDNGLVEAAGFSIYHFNDNQNQHYPGWFATIAAQVMIMADSLRFKAGRPDVPIIMNCEFWHDGSAKILYHDHLGFSESYSPETKVEIGPFSVLRRTDFMHVFREIEREIWFGLGAPKIQQLNFDFETSINKYNRK